MTRVAFYSHDTFGLGHLRRCLKLAQALARRFEAIDGLLLTGSAWSRLFVPPSGFRFASLPAVIKSGPGRYRSRDPRAAFEATLAERRRRIAAALSAFRPDLLIVDNVPCGLHGEMLSALRELKRRPGPKAVLALRDVLDRTDVVLREWSEAGAEEAVADLFDEIWIFGDPSDAARLADGGPLGWAPRKVHPCGRLGPPQPGRRGRTRRALTERPTVLVTGGGGADAGPLVRTYLDALRCERPTVTSRVVLGPDFPRGGLRQPGSAAAGGLRIRRFVPDLPERLAASDVVVAMAGYNTVCEILASGRPAVLVPRVYPRQEQLLRALEWRDRGRVQVILPDALSPAGLWRAVEELLEGPAPAPLRFAGGGTAAARAAALVGA